MRLKKTTLQQNNIDDLFYYKWPNAFIALKGFTTLVIYKSESINNKKVQMHSISIFPHKIMCGEFDSLLKKYAKKTIKNNNCFEMKNKKHVSFLDLYDIYPDLKKISFQKENI